MEVCDALKGLDDEHELARRMQNQGNYGDKIQALRQRQRP